VKNGKIELVAELLQVFNQEGKIIKTETIVDTANVKEIDESSQLDKIWNGYDIEIFN